MCTLLRERTIANVSLNVPHTQELLQRKVKVFDSPWGPGEIRDQLARESPERTQAAKAGLIRPFLLMVSMHPSQRNRIGVCVCAVLTK
jgi:hypothetical protein